MKAIIDEINKFEIEEVKFIESWEDLIRFITGSIDEKSEFYPSSFKAVANKGISTSLGAHMNDLREDINRSCTGMVPIRTGEREMELRLVKFNKTRILSSFLKFGRLPIARFEHSSVWLVHHTAYYLWEPNVPFTY